MSFDLQSIRSSKQNRPPRVTIHGPEGIGKSTFGASAPSPIFLPTEDGIDALDVPAFPQAKSYEDVEEALTALHGKHDYQTLVVDSIDWLEPLVWQKTCKDRNWSDIEQPGYGKGYIAAVEQWAELLRAFDSLRGRGMAVVLIAHSHIKRFDDPTTEPYDRYRIKLQDRAAAKIREWSDIIGFASQRIITQKTDVGFNKKISRGVATGERMLHLTEAPAYEAKNRYALPDSISLSWDALMEQLNKEEETD